MKFFLSITENGFPVKGEDTMSIQQALKDYERVNYFKGATDALMKAIHDDGIDIRCYFSWSTSSSFLPLQVFPTFYY